MDVSHDDEARDLSVVHQEVTMESQAHLILSRIHRLQGRQSQRHLQKHVQAFVRHEQAATGIGCQNLRMAKDRREPNGRIVNVRQLTPPEDKSRLIKHDGIKNMSTSTFANLVKKLESSGFNATDGFPSSCDEPSTSFNSDNLASSSVRMKAATRGPHLDPSSALHRQSPSINHGHQLPPAAICTSSNLQINAPEHRNVIDCTVGTLKCNLHHLETDYDSDATDSSSGGDSCDESSHLNALPLNGFASNTSSPSTPSFSRKHSTSNSGTSHLKESFSWKWVGERGAIAARWMWLFAQVADLEFKIRQQNEMYRTLRSSKGPIILEASATEPQAMSSEPSESSDQPADSSTQCVRTMPVRTLRKRRLVRASVALSGATRKSARYSTVQCSCSSLPSFVSPCLLCNGRYSYVQVIDTDCMPQFERIALLDSSCHPVISLPNRKFAVTLTENCVIQFSPEIPLGLHFAKFLKRETVQRSPSKNQLKIESRRKALSGHEFNNKFGKDQGRKNSLKKSQAVISSNKLKKKYDNSKRKSDFDHSSSGKRSKGNRERHESSSNGSFDGSFRIDSSPIIDSVPRRRRSEHQHAFDINNIVIPYSIASTTRVEKLQYKEILTPKWREVDFETCLPDPKSNESEPIDGLLEDLSEATFVDRHKKCEIEERKRFLTFLTPTSTTPGAHRGRGMARCDSKSEPTTGNGFGPVDDTLISDHNNSGVQEDSFVANIVTHPLKDFVKTSHLDSQVHGMPARAFERRRTTSSSRREDSIDEDHQEIAPYEKRSFPLLEEDLVQLEVDEEEEEPFPIQSNGSSLKEVAVPEVKREFPVSPVKEVTFSHPAKDQDHSLPATPRSDKSLSVSVSGLSASPSSETDPEEAADPDPEWAPEVV